MKWTEEELKFLLDNYCEKSVKDLAIIMNRSIRSIEIKLKRLGKSLNDRKWEVISCKHCNKEVKSLKSDNRNFCSRSCSVSFNNSKRIISEEQRKKVSQSLMGRTSPFRTVKRECETCGNPCKTNWNRFCKAACVRKSDKYKKEASERMKQRFIDFPELHPNRLCAGIKESYPEKFLTDYLIENNLEEDIHFKKQYKVGTYYVDFYFPKTNVVIEVDGERWHNPDCPKEIKRENTIKEKYILHRFRAKPLLNKEYTETIDEIIKSAKH